MKTRLLTLFIIVIIGFGCVRNELVRDDISLKYMNYLNQDSIPSRLTDLFREIKCDSFDVNFLKKTKLTLLKGEAYDYFFHKEDSFGYEFEKEKWLYGHYDDHPHKIPTQNLNDIYAIGKIKFHNGVDGLVLVFQTPKNGIFYDGVDYSEIILFTIKNNKLCSIVNLSSYGIKKNQNEDLIRTYKTDKECYTQINFYGLTDITSPNICEDCDNWSNMKNLDDVKRKLGLETKIKRLRFTMFYIDKIGFVRYISSIGAEEYQLPSILTQKSNWKTIHSLGSTM